jgi:hypothetical protein
MNESRDPAAAREGQNDTKPDFRGEHYNFTLMVPLFQPGSIEHPRNRERLRGMLEMLAAPEG